MWDVYIMEDAAGPDPWQVEAVAVVGDHLVGLP